MSFLQVFDAANPTEPKRVLEDGNQIMAALGGKGVRFERWQASQPLSSAADQEEILTAYSAEVARLKAKHGFQTADVISLTPDHPDKAALRAKFLSEHIHSEDEVRFFVRGSGLFYMHLDDEIYAVGCQQEDLISVPAGTKHWFDMGAEPNFTCVRLFTNPEGWVAQYTEDKIADQFPRFEDLMA